MAEIKKVWWVKDPTEVSEMWEDFVWEVEVDSLPNIMRGTSGNRYWDEHTKLYDDKASAMTDAKKRWEKMKKKLLSQGKTPAVLEGEKTATMGSVLANLKTIREVALTPAVPSLFNGDVAPFGTVGSLPNELDGPRPNMPRGASVVFRFKRTRGTNP